MVRIPVITGGMSWPSPSSQIRGADFHIQHLGPVGWRCLLYHGGTLPLPCTCYFTETAWHTITFALQISGLGKLRFCLFNMASCDMGQFSCFQFSCQNLPVLIFKTCKLVFSIWIAFFRCYFQRTTHTWAVINTLAIIPSNRGWLMGILTSLQVNLIIIPWIAFYTPSTPENERMSPEKGPCSKGKNGLSSNFQPMFFVSLRGGLDVLPKNTRTVSLTQNIKHGVWKVSPNARNRSQLERGRFS